MPVELIIRHPNLLLVEGIDEQLFLETLLSARRLTNIQLYPLEGKSALPTKLDTIAKTARGFDDLRWIGIARDADDDPSAAFKSICGALKKIRLPVPKRPWEAIGSSPEVVAFVWPDGNAPGDIETLVWEATQREPAGTCVDAYFACLHGAGLNLPRQIHKARVHAYLASLSQPDLRLGHAAQKGFLPLSSPVFDRFLELLPPQGI